MIFAINDPDAVVVGGREVIFVISLHLSLYKRRNEPPLPSPPLLHSGPQCLRQTWHLHSEDSASSILIMPSVSVRASSLPVM